MVNKIYDVTTPHGVGQVWGIDRGKVLVEMDYMYLVEFAPEEVEGLETADSDA